MDYSHSDIGFVRYLMGKDGKDVSDTKIFDTLHKTETVHILTTAKLLLVAQGKDFPTKDISEFINEIEEIFKDKQAAELSKESENLSVTLKDVIDNTIIYCNGFGYLVKNGILERDPILDWR